LLSKVCGLWGVATYAGGAYTGSYVCAAGVADINSDVGAIRQFQIELEGTPLALQLQDTTEVRMADFPGLTDSETQAEGRHLMTEPTRFVGVDVQVARGCPYVVLDKSGEPIDCGWLAQRRFEELAQTLCAVVDRHSVADQSLVGVGIDAPRVPLPSPRQWYWDGAKGKWRPRRASDRGYGRHCDVVIAAHRLANPQWTPYHRPFPPWMELGFELFKALGKRPWVYEVFPAASYELLANDTSVRIGVRLSDFAPGPKDMLDAYIAAATVREFAQGRGAPVGGGDGFGQIVLPRPLPNMITPVLAWPAALRGRDEHGSQNAAT
jgi:predicted nuclease with RNAse H fold